MSLTGKAKLSKEKSKNRRIKGILALCLVEAITASEALQRQASRSWRVMSASRQYMLKRSCLYSRSISAVGHLFSTNCEAFKSNEGLFIG